MLNEKLSAGELRSLHQRYVAGHSLTLNMWRSMGFTFEKLLHQIVERVGAESQPGYSLAFRDDSWFSELILAIDDPLEFKNLNPGPGNAITVGAFALGDFEQPTNINLDGPDFDDISESENYFHMTLLWTRPFELTMLLDCNKCFWKCDGPHRILADDHLRVTMACADGPCTSSWSAEPWEEGLDKGLAEAAWIFVSGHMSQHELT